MAEPTELLEPITEPEPVPEVPPPVEIPEYYTGFAQEFEQVGVDLQQAYKALQQAEKILMQPTALHLLSEGFWREAWATSLYVHLIEPFFPEEAKQAITAEAQAEFDAAARAFQTAEWKLEVMQVLPIYLSDPYYEVNNIEDVLKLIVPGVELTDADTAWLNEAFGKLSHLTNVLPEDYSGDILDAQSKILNEILTEPKLELKGVHKLTIEEIAKAFAFSVAELPAGMTEEDVRSLLSKLDISDEELKDQREWLAERAREWEIESARMNLIRAGTILAETPELTPGQWAKLIVTQPMMATVELMQKWWDAISRPISAAIMIHLPAPVAGVAHGVPLMAVTGGIIGSIVPGIGTAIGAGIFAIVGAIGGAAWFSTWEDEASKELTKHYEFYRNEGESAWSSYAKAFNEWNAPWWQKAILDSAYDPLFWIGWGGATAVGRKLMTTALPRGLKQVGTRIGSLMVAFEQGYCAGADAVFRGAMRVVAAPIKSAFWLTGAGYTIPKTFTQMSRNFARKGLMDIKAVLDRTYPHVRNLRGLTAKDVHDTTEAVIRAALNSPMEGNNLAVRAGANLLEFNYLDDVVAAKFVKEAAGEVMFDTSRLARFNSNILDAFSGQGDRITAGKILGDLGIEATENSVKNLAIKIGKFKDTVARKAADAVKGDTADEMLMSIFNRLESTRYGNLHSPLTQYMQQAGRSASWHSRVADRILYSTQLVRLEREVVMPIARHQLLFTNFGPFNYTENMGRSFLGGAEIMHPKAYGGVAETNRLFKGLSNAPYELQLFERGQVRLTQAMVDPKTGVTAVFKGGKIPFITKNVRIPEKIPRFGGKMLGKTITIGDQRYFIGSAQDWYDMWSKLTADQTAFDVQTHFLKALEDIAPDDMRAISEVIEVKTKSMLDDIASITKRDAFDIRRELRLEAVGGGPESLRLFGDIDVITFQRRQISKELNRIMDNMTDVHAITKTGIRDEVLDGTMFTRGADSIDDRIAARVASERELNIASLSNQMDALKAEADAFIANPPRNLDDFLGDMQSITAHVEGVGERIHDFRRITELRKAKLLPADFDNFEVGSAKMLADFMETSEESLTKIMNQLMENARAFPKFNIGYRAGKVKVSTGIAATEGEGLYITTGANAEALAKRFATKKAPVGKIEYLEPRNPFTVKNEPMPILTGKDEMLVYNPIKATDSEWVKMHKEAVQRLIKRGELEFGQLDLSSATGISKELGIVAREKGYDAFRITYGGGSWDVLLDDTLWKNLPKKGQTILSEVQLARLADLDSISRLELDNILATRTKIADIEAIIPRTAKRNRTERFWTQQRAQKSAIWDEFDTLSRRLKGMRLASSRNFLTSVDKSVYVPDFVPDVVGELTPNHLAYLYGVTGDDLYRGLTRVQHHITVRPREDFIVHTKDYANAYAAKFGKTAEQLGFTDDAIGEVYDQMWKNLGIDPSILTPDHPTMLQLEEIRQELHRLYGSTKIPESDVIKWRKYINSVADEVGETLAYKVAPTVPRVKYTRGSFEWRDVPIEQQDKIVTMMNKIQPDIKPKGFGIAPPGYAEFKGRIGKLDAFTEIDTIVFKNTDSIVPRIMHHELTHVRRAAGIAPPPRVPAKPAVGGTPDWWAKKESAMLKAREMHKLSYPTYEDANILDETMRAIFPFWNYELFRWKWIPRTFLRTPGTMSALARYVEYTDQGYMPVPGTDLQINILRGTVWMGGLRSFYLRDFPEYHDAVPGIEFLDYIGRAGFFPGIHVMLPIVGVSSLVSKKSLQLGELTPAWIDTGLSALRALSPEHIGAVLEIVYPDRFRDYMTMLTLAGMGYDGDEIWKKKQQNIELTEEEKKLWLQAVNKVDGVKGILMNQTGLFRIRPDEFTEIRKQMRLAIEEATGVPVKTQDWIDRMYPVTGKRFSDYFHLDVQQQALLYQWESFRRYQGIITPLYPSSWQALDIKRSDYYQELDKVFSEARYHGRYDDEGNLLQHSIIDINQQFVDGTIGPSQWRTLRNDVQDGLSEAAYILGESPAYKDVPKSFEEMAELLEKRGIVVPTQTPDQELLYYYFELKPELKYNWESDRIELDFDTYYAYIDILLESLSPQHRDRMLERIHNDWTPMEILYWEFSRNFARPYRNIRAVVLNEYTDEQVKTIRRFEVARGQERLQLLEVMGPDGKLIAGYQKRLREARLRLRMLDPTLDAWLNFFGTTDKLVSIEANEIYSNLRKQYLVPAMVGEAK